MKKLSNTVAELKKKAAYKKNVYLVYQFGKFDITGISEMYLST